MTYWLQQSLQARAIKEDFLYQQSSQWGMGGSMLLVTICLLIVFQNYDQMLRLASRHTEVQNVLNLEYQVVRPEPVVEQVEPEVEPTPEPVPEPVVARETIVPEKIRPVRKKKKQIQKLQAEKQEVHKKLVQAVKPVAQPSAPHAKPVEVPLEQVAYESAQVDSIPAAVAKQKPAYPYRARRMNVRGFVEIRFLVNSQGKVEEFEVVSARPVETFEKSAREAVMQWRFKPGMKNGKPVATWMTTTINFELE